MKAVLGEPLQFTGAKEAFEDWQDGTDVGLLAEFNVWAMNEPKCQGEMLNIVNGDLFRWSIVWPLLADGFGAKIPDNQCGSQRLPHHNPISNHTISVVATVPRGVNPKSWKKFSIEKEMTSKYPDATSTTTKAEYAWKLLCEQDRTLDPNAWQYATWDFADQVLTFGSLASMNKAKSFGWTGWRDTEKMFIDQWDAMRNQNIVPRVKVVPAAQKSRM